MIQEYLKDHIGTGSNKRVLDIGSGSGYMTCLLARMNTEGFTYGVEHVYPLY